MIRRVLRFCVNPLFRLLVRVVSVGDPWERLDIVAPLGQYGSGARLDFSEYLEGERLVAVSSLDDICTWLLGCSYLSDEVLFHEPDFWQHPSTFERVRAGDCEDFAIWSWRKLPELGFDADLVAGYCLRDGALAGRHVWVLFKQSEVENLFEPVARARERMVLPLDDVRDRYLPEFGVDRHAKRFAFSGYLAAQKRVLAKQRAERSPVPEAG